jgi:hypothetical protein
MQSGEERTLVIVEGGDESLKNLGCDLVLIKKSRQRDT